MFRDMEDGVYIDDLSVVSQIVIVEDGLVVDSKPISLSVTEDELSGLMRFSDFYEGCYDELC